VSFSEIICDAAKANVNGCGDGADFGGESNAVRFALVCDKNNLLSLFSLA